MLVVEVVAGLLVCALAIVMTVAGVVGLLGVLRRGPGGPVRQLRAARAHVHGPPHALLRPLPEGLAAPPPLRVAPGARGQPDRAGPLGRPTARAPAGTRGAPAREHLLEDRRA